MCPSPGVSGLSGVDGLTRDEHLIEAGKDLDVFAPHVSGAAMGNLVLPQFAPGMGLVLEYARLRLLAAALADGALPVAAALAAPAGTNQPAIVGPPVNGSGLIIPS